MEKNAKPGEPSKGQAMRDLITQNPELRAPEVVAILAKQDVKVNVSLFYYVKGKMSGKRGRKKEARRMVENVTRIANGPKSSDVITTIIKVKHLAAEVGGLRKLLALVEALGG